MFRFVLVAVAMLAGPAWADSAIPYAALKPYAEFRAEIMKAGWTYVGPDKLESAEFYDGVDRFPEMTCNLAGLCWAEWVSSQSNNLLLKVTVWYDRSDPERFRLAPDYD